eukprot:4423944-Alexandrium_andersonii.AAC.1
MRCSAHSRPGEQGPPTAQSHPPGHADAQLPPLMGELAGSSQRRHRNRTQRACPLWSPPIVSSG